MGVVNIGDSAALYCGDCLEILREMKSGEADVVITSPPYNMRTRIRDGKYATGEQCDSDFTNKYLGFSDALPVEDYHLFHRAVLDQILRISRLAFINIQIVTGSKEAWFRLMGDFASKIRDVVIWDKGEGQPAMHPAVINRGSELILILESDAVAGRAFNRSFFERGTMPDIWRLGRGNSDVEGHGAVFPISLPSRAILGWTRPGDVVLDPFMGTGTTGMAAINLGRKFMGIELVREYFDIAKTRIERAYSQLPLLPA